MRRILISTLLLLSVWITHANNKKSGVIEREIWVSTLTKIADPVVTNLANGTLRANMPQEGLDKRRLFSSHLEAVGRTICGIAPWLELGEDDTPEGKLRGKYIKLVIKGLANAVNPESPDYLDFHTPSQPLVDAAFLAQGLLRAPQQIWRHLDEVTKERMIIELKRSRRIKPFQNNWLLFASMIEAALLEFTGECDMERLLTGVYAFRDKWYKGDATYGDGPNYHADYYNSFVIHPMLTDVIYYISKHKLGDIEKFVPTQMKRFTRYAEQQERLISPEGTYPVIGRSIVYRTGVFHALAHASLLHKLPDSVKPAQVRCALTLVITRQYASPNTFDKNGWLRIGFTGSQIMMSEGYINTGSSYLCLTGFLALGLPSTDPFWTAPVTPWTNLKAWEGEEVKRDYAI